MPLKIGDKVIAENDGKKIIGEITDEMTSSFDGKKRYVVGVKETFTRYVAFLEEELTPCH